MKTPREIARELMDYISKCACEESPCSCGFSRDCRLIEQALIEYGNERIEACAREVATTMPPGTHIYTNNYMREMAKHLRSLKTKKEKE